MKFIVGWKAIANICGVTERSVRRWHNHKAKLPFIKTAKYKSGIILVEPEALKMWIQQVCESPQFDRTWENRDIN